MTAVAQPGPRKRPRNRRRAIISAAERLFADRGYTNTSMKQLAAAVGITDASLYNHFTSKRDILEALYEERGFPQALDVLEHLPGTMSTERQFQMNALASADLWAQNADFLRIVISEVLAGDPVARSVHNQIMERWHAGIRRLLALYATQTVLDPQQIETASAALVHLHFGTMVEKMLEEPAGNGAQPFSEPAFRQKLIDQVTMFCRSLLSTGPPSARQVGTPPEREEDKDE